MINIKEWRLIAQDFKLAGAPMIIQVSQMNEILDRLEALEKERDELRTELKEVRHGAAVAHDVINALRAKISEMEKQEPVWFIDERGEPKRYHKGKADYCKYGGLDLLYNLPGAKGE